MRRETRWERFRRRFIWGKWSAREGGVRLYRSGPSSWLIVGRLRIDLRGW